jgi:hypothetical protein
MPSRALRLERAPRGIDGLRRAALAAEQEFAPAPSRAASNLAKMRTARGDRMQASAR